MRLLNLIVAAALVLAAAYVYKIKVAATVEAERVAKLRMEITRERDIIAALRAETAKLENPARIQRLANRYLSLQPLDPAQIEGIDAIPLRTTDSVEPEIVTAAPAQPESPPAKPQTASKSANPPAQPQTVSKSANPPAQPQTASRPPAPTSPSQAASRSTIPSTQPQAPSTPTTAAVRPKPVQAQPAPVPPRTAPWDIITGAIRPPAPIGAR